MNYLLSPPSSCHYLSINSSVQLCPFALIILSVSLFLKNLKKRKSNLEKTMGLSRIQQKSSNLGSFSPLSIGLKLYSSDIF